MRYLISARTTKPRVDVLAPEVNEVAHSDEAALFEVFLADDHRLPFERALHQVVDNVDGIDFDSTIVVTNEYGDKIVFFVDLTSGTSSVVVNSQARHSIRNATTS